MTIPDGLFMSHTVEVFGVMALTGICLLYAFVMHVKVRDLARRGQERHRALENRVEQLASAAGQLRSQLEETARPASPAGLALNLSKRGQALRMRRRGENIETIQAALNIPRNELDLLLKVHQ